MAAFDGDPQARSQRRVVRGMTQEVRHAEGDMSRLVDCRQPHHFGGAAIGRVGLKEAEQIEEGAFAKHAEQEAGEGEVRLVDEGLQRCLTTAGREAELVACEQGSPGEHLDVTSFVRSLDRK